MRRVPIRFKSYGLLTSLSVGFFIRLCSGLTSLIAVNAINDHFNSLQITLAKQPERNLIPEKGPNATGGTLFTA